MIEMLVVIAILALLITLVSPGISRTLEKSRDMKCFSQLRQLTTVTLAIASERGGGILRANDDHYVGSKLVDGDWIRHVGAYLSGVSHDTYVQTSGHRDQSMFICPSVKIAAEGPSTIQYGMNRYFERQQWGWGEPYKSMGWREDPTRYELITVLEIQNPARTFLFGDKTTLDWAPLIAPTGAYIPEARHNGMAHFSFVDGHVEALEPAEYVDTDYYLFLN